MLKTKKGKPAKERVSVTDLLQLLPQDYLDELATELFVDKWVRKLPASALFKLVLFSLLSGERLSLRMMEDHYADPLFRAMAATLSADEVTWVGIRQRLTRLSTTYCQRLYDKVYEQLQQHYGREALAGYHLRRYDSTMISTFSHLLSGMKVGNSSKGKEQVKLTTEFTDDFLLTMHFHSDQAHLSEETALKEALLAPQHRANDISVFDKGLKSRQTFAQLDQQGIRFVGRLQAQPRYDVLHPVWQDGGVSDTEELEFVQDSAVHLYEDGYKVVPTKLRLVQFRIKEAGGEGPLLSFITNAWELEAQVIAEIYRRRWDIEVLFRFLKQEMSLSHFVCNDPNAIEVMLYFTLIAAMLVLVYKQQNGISSYRRAKRRFFKELFYSLLVDILEVPDGVEWIKTNAQKFVNLE